MNDGEVIVKKLIYGIRHISNFVLLIAFLLSLLISYSLLGEKVENIVMGRIANYTLGIEVLEDYSKNSSPNREVWINSIMLGDVSDMKTLYQNAEATEFEYRSAADFGYTNDVLVNVGQENGKIKFSWIGGTKDFVKFWMQNLSGTVKITLQKQGEIVDQQTVDLYTTKPDQTYVYEIGEFQHTPVQYTILQYGILLFAAILVFVVIVSGLSTLMFKYDKDNNGQGD